VSEQTTILDYASPRPAGAARVMRLPARSDLKIDELDQPTDAPPHPPAVRIIETLRGQGGAIVSVVFALFVMLTMLMVMLNVRARRDVGAFICLGPFWLTMAALIPCVINSTWRRTVVEADRHALRIRLRAPLWGRRKLAWDVDRVAGVDALQWADGSARSSSVARIVITIRDARPLVLFSGHDLRELLWIAGRMRDAMGWDRNGPQRAAGVSGA
jgi:hypothetical protein